MKTIYLSILLVLFITSADVYSQTNGRNISYSAGYDSLLFDGESNARTETFYSISGNDCEFRVTYVKGTATGKIKKMQIFDVCGVRKDTIYEYVNGAIEKYSVIKGGEMVKIGPESTAKIELPDGSEIVLGPNTNYTLPTSACDLMSNSSLVMGSLWVKLKKLIGGGKFEVSTERMVNGVRGTEFTIEIIEENGIKNDVTKVYEGSVEVKLVGTGNINSIDEAAKELDKLQEDYNNGKVTMEEYMKKTQEYLAVMQGKAVDMRKSVMVEPGYLVKTDGKVLGDPVQFNTSEDTWFKINE